MPGVVNGKGPPVLRADGAAYGASPREADIDSLSVLPLDLLPLNTPALADARMLKTARLDSVVEMTHEDGRESGPIAIDTIPAFLGSRNAALEKDLRLLESVGRLPSFDVYSLRMELRGLGIATPPGQLVLSARKREELAPYLRGFTAPLLARVFGGGTEAPDDLGALFRGADRETILANLRRLAGRLGIPLHAVPDFLTRFGDVFTSIAYFRGCNSGARKVLGEFSGWLMATERMPSVRANPPGLRSVADVQRLLVELTMHLDDCFTNLDRLTAGFWEEASPDAFEDNYRLIEAHHPVLGAVLCGLAVKMDSWQTTFPEREGAPAKRLDWLRQDMLPGLEPLRDTAQMAIVKIADRLN